jgi:hypothetical protein
LNIESVLILALNEPRNYSQWFAESCKIRKEFNQSLSRRKFNDAKKRLEGSNVITVHNIDLRTKEFKLVNHVQDLNNIFESHEKRLHQLSNQMSDVVNAVEKSKSAQRKTLASNMKFFARLLDMMKNVLKLQTSLVLLSSHGVPKIFKSKIKKNIEFCHKILEDEFRVATKINPDFADRLYQSLNRELG